MRTASSATAIDSARPSPWPARLAWATWLAAVPLVFLGGSVTSTDSGLAIDGWWIVDRGKGDWFLLFYPLDRWVHSVGTFVEHSHRLFGTLVGLLSIATVLAAWFGRATRLGRMLALAALVAVCIQGLLGGLRVLEKSTDLAFLHGALGQAVFALLGIAALALGRRTPPRARTRELVQLLRLAQFATLAVYAQIVLGAWLRHGQSLVALVAHIVFLTAVVAHVVLLANALRKARATLAEPEVLARGARHLWLAFWAQVTLGLLAFVWVYVVVGAGRTPTELHEALFPTLHVIGGALLLFACAALWLEAARRLQPEAAPPTEAPLTDAADRAGQAATGGAR